MVDGLRLLNYVLPQWQLFIISRVLVSIIVGVVYTAVFYRRQTARQVIVGAVSIIMGISVILFGFFDI